MAALGFLNRVGWCNLLDDEIREKLQREAQELILSINPQF